MKDSLLEWYLDSSWRVPPRLAQWFLDRYLNVAARYDIWREGTHRRETSLPEVVIGAEELMSAHYDQPLALFQGFLSPELKYSTGLWMPQVTNLAEAQQTMMTDLVRKARIEEGQTVLDLGCGFGSLASHILSRFCEVRVCGVSLSSVQCDYIRSLQKQKGHPLASERFELLQVDFADLDLSRRFDRVLSVGMFEHISNLRAALDILLTHLRPAALVLLHYIVCFPPIDRLPPRPNLLTERVFPGGRVWGVEALLNELGRFKLRERWVLPGRHYRQTLETWLYNLRQNAKTLHERDHLPERLLRLWELYLSACVAVFKSGNGSWYGNGQYLIEAPAQNP